MLGFAPLASAALASSGDTNTRVLYLAATEANDTSAVTINITGTASLTATDTQDVVSITVGVATVIYLNATEASDQAAINIQNINVYLAGVETSDAAVISCTMSGTIYMAATEAPDVYSQSAYALWTTPNDPNDPSIWVPKNDPAPYLTTVI